jgi:hypothetical protein
MKLLTFRNHSRCRAATLVEFMVALLTMMISVIAILSAYMFGMRTTEFVKPKLMASDAARKTLSLINDEIRSAKSIRLGIGSANTFTDAPPFSLQVGSALHINTSTNTNLYVRYFLDTADKRLKRTTSANSSVSIVAESVTNRLPFTFEDYTGKVVSNRPAIMIVGMTLQFLQTNIVTASNAQTDFFQLSTKVTKRTY